MIEVFFEICSLCWIRHFKSWKSDITFEFSDIEDTYTYIFIWIKVFSFPKSVRYLDVQKYYIIFRFSDVEDRYTKIST